MRRSELYEKVWSRPVIKLAQELGITDVGLAKLCRRHAIPVPPRGYWAKVRAGQRPSMIPLPTPDKDEVIVLSQKPSTDNRQQVLIKNARKVAACAAGFQEDLAVGELVFLVGAVRINCRSWPRLCKNIINVNETWWVNVKSVSHHWGAKLSKVQIVANPRCYPCREHQLPARS
jgi:hypothetical protein